MSEIHRTVTVDAAAEKVVDLLGDPQKIGLLMPNGVQVVDVKPGAQRVGTTFRVIYRRLGVEFDESVVVSRLEAPPRNTPHRRYQVWWSFQGLAQGASVWTLEALDNHTEVGIDVEYRLMGGVVGRAVDWLLIGRANEKTTAQMLGNMKRRLATALS